MCKAHSKVTHIKQQKYFYHLKRPGYNTELLFPLGISCFQSVRFFSFNFDLIAVIVMSFWVSYCGNMTSYRFFNMAAAVAQYYFRFRIC